MTLTRLEPVSGLPWTVIRGDRRTVMTELGRAHAEQIAAWRELPGWARLVERATEPDGPGHDVFDAVVASSRRLLPVESQELEWLAAGAGVPAAELWAVNLRGDLGRDGTGCSDLCTAAAGRVLMGHNEDGDAELADLVRVVTLRIDGDPTVTVVWYPGMLPANSFVTTSAGLSFEMDHVPVGVSFTGGAGRHLVARHAQRQADGRAARTVLETLPCAGGFAFDLADGPGGRADLIENAAGRVASAGAAGQPGAEPLHHTNHLLLLDGRREGLAVDPADPWLAESRTRRRRLVRAAADHRLDPSQTPAAASSAERLAAALRSDGVLNRRPGIWTFATAVADPAADRIWLQGKGAPWTGVLSAFAAGERISCA